VPRRLPRRWFSFSISLRSRRRRRCGHQRVHRGSVRVGTAPPAGKPVLHSAGALLRDSAHRAERAMRINILAAALQRRRGGHVVPDHGARARRVATRALAANRRRIDRRIDRSDCVHRLGSVGGERKSLHRLAAWTGSRLVADRPLVRRSRWTQSGSTPRDGRVPEWTWLCEPHGRVSCAGPQLRLPLRFAGREHSSGRSFSSLALARCCSA